MAPMGQGQMEFKAGGRVNIGFVILIITLCSIWKLTIEEGTELAMAKIIPHVMECYCEGRIYGRNLSGKSVERLGINSEATY